jgi:hypothetical protein
MLFRNFSKITPSVELSLKNDLSCKTTVSLFKDSIHSSHFKVVSNSCITELQTNLDNFMKVEEKYPEKKGRISVYLSVEYTPE